MIQIDYLNISPVFEYAIRLARVCAFVVIFWLAGSPSLLATGNCPPNANRGMISLVRDVEGNSQSRQKKMPTHLLRRKMMSLFLTLAERIHMKFKSNIQRYPLVNSPPMTKEPKK